MSVSMTNCGSLGWISDGTGYRYDSIDPDSGRTWPSMPDSFLKLATGAAEKAGFQQFKPDACLINRYETGAVARQRGFQWCTVTWSSGAARRDFDITESCRSRRASTLRSVPIG
jgi:hypothetical protein